MTIAYDSAAEAAAVTGAPQTLSLVPVGTLRHVLLLGIQTGNSNDIVTGVTANGTALARAGTYADTIGEAGRVYAYSLGSAIPSGTLSISVARSEGTTSIHWVAIGHTAAGDTEIVDIDGLSANQLDPQVTLQYGGRTCLAVCALYSAVNAVTAMTEIAGVTRVHDNDFGNEVSIVSRQSVSGSSDFTIGYTSGGVTDDLAMIGLAISEVVPDITPSPVTGSGGSGLPRSPAFLAASLRGVRDLAGLLRVLGLELPRFAQHVACYEPVARPAYGTVVRPGGQVSRVQLIRVTDTNPFTVANPDAPREGIEITLDIWNDSGGSMGAITWGGEYALLPTAFVNPQSGKHRLISFYRAVDVKWRETRRSTADLD